MNDEPSSFSPEESPKEVKWTVHTATVPTNKNQIFFF